MNTPHSHLRLLTRVALACGLAFLIQAMSHTAEAQTGWGRPSGSCANGSCTPASPVVPGLRPIQTWIPVVWPAIPTGSQRVYELHGGPPATPVAGNSDLSRDFSRTTIPPIRTNATVTGPLENPFYDYRERPPRASRPVARPSAPAVDSPYYP